MKPINEMTLAECLDHADHLLHWDERGDNVDTVKECLAHIRELTRWIPVKERLPTQEDADHNNSVFVQTTHRSGYQQTDVWFWDAVTPEPIGGHTPTHWRRIDKP